MQIIATPSAAQVATALRNLARDMNDPYRMDDALLTRALGTHTHAILAANPDPVGVAVYTLFPSTTRGQIGAFVTDLWVDKTQRGTGLGRTLLTRVRDETAAQWGATFLRLNHYTASPAADFYARLGFTQNPSEIWVTLEGQALKDLA